jgi:hypothetical protein
MLKNMLRTYSKSEINIPVPIAIYAQCCHLPICPIITTIIIPESYHDDRRLLDPFWDV